MTERKLSSKTSKLKNFLVTGSVEEREPPQIEKLIEEAPPESTPPEDEWVREEGLREVEMELTIEDIISDGPIEGPEREYVPQPQIQTIDTSALEKEIVELKEMIAGLASELGKYTTSKEQLKEYSSAVNRRDAEAANKKFMRMLEQLSAMREDFFKLCKGINAKLDSFSPKDILSSFEAFGVDMENIDRKSTRLNSSHSTRSRMPSSA
jgi:hypothetical protein